MGASTSEEVIVYGACASYSAVFLYGSELTSTRAAHLRTPNVHRSPLVRVLDPVPRDLRRTGAVHGPGYGNEGNTPDMW